MNKRVLTFFAVVGLSVGTYIPILFGWDPMGLNGLSILGGFIGGIVGLVVGVKISSLL